MGTTLNIFYSNPYDLDKNIGKAYNDYIKSLKAEDDDWIVMQDGDIIYLTPDWGKRIHDALLLDGDKFGLVGCWTNRLRSTDHLHGNKFSFDNDMKAHHEIANTYQGEGIAETKHLVAGLFMAFKYKTWKAVGGFTEANLGFDSIFNMKVKDKGFKVGIINSLYVYHLYRIWADTEPWNEKKHLLK